MTNTFATVSAPSALDVSPPSLVGPLEIASDQAFTAYHGGGYVIYLADLASPDVGIYDTAGDWDLIGGDDGTIDIYGAQASVVGQADTIDFVDDNVDDAVSVYATSGKWDEISGSDGLVYLTDAQANVFGGGDTIRLAGDGDAVSLYGTDGNWDAVGVDDATVYVTSAQTNVDGGGDTVRLAGAGCALSLYDTDGNWDAVGAVDATVYATSAQTNVDGGGDMIKLVGDGAAVSLYTTNGNWDAVSADDATIYETHAQTNVVGGGDAIKLSATDDNEVSLYSTDGNWDSVNSDYGVIYETSAQTNVFGGDDTIYFSGGSGNRASLYNTGAAWDNVVGDNATLYLTNAKASLTGHDDRVNFTPGTTNSVSLYGNGGSSAWDTVSGSNGTIDLTVVNTSVVGGGDTIEFLGDLEYYWNGAVSLYGTNGDPDTIFATEATIYVNSAQANVVGEANSFVLTGADDVIGIVDATSNSGNDAMGSNATFALTSATLEVQGNDDVVDFRNADCNASFWGRDDTLNGSLGTVSFGSEAAPKINGSSNIVWMPTDDNLDVLVNGGDEFFQVDNFGGFGGIPGPVTANNSITGFETTDVINLYWSNLATWNALRPNISQSGANAVIALSPTNTLTLTGVNASSLVSSEFSFINP